MEMSYKAPLRNYQQMVRVVKKDANQNSYNLASAFGDQPPSDSTDKRMRSLDEMGIPSSSLRRPAPEVHGGNFSTRISTIFYHSLNGRSQGYFNGHPPDVHSRTDTLAGTKERTELSTHSFSKKIEPTIQLSPFHSPSSSSHTAEKKGYNAFNSGSVPSPDKG